MEYIEGFNEFIAETFWPAYLENSQNLEFIPVGLAAFVCSSLFYRYAHEYRCMYITAKQVFTRVSVLITVIPIILSAIGAIFSKHSQFSFGLATISSILSIFYPLLLGSKIVAIASLFPITLFVSALLETIPSAVYLLYAFAIVFCLIRFDNETPLTTFIYSKVILFILLADLFGLICAPTLGDAPYCVQAGFIGAFLGFLLEKIL